MRLLQHLFETKPSAISVSSRNLQMRKWIKHTSETKPKQIRWISTWQKKKDMHCIILWKISFKINLQKRKEMKCELNWFNLVLRAKFRHLFVAFGCATRLSSVKRVQTHRTGAWDQSKDDKRKINPINCRQ